jgi:response regulator RpfG family c-di-GMP phosphodiesterase
VKLHDPDVILLDAMLPDVHGFDVCRRLKASQRYRHIPVIMVTAIYKGWRMAADLTESYGVLAVVEKPFDLHHLARLVESALSGRAANERPSPEVLSAEAQRLYRDGAAAYKAGDMDGAVAALVAAAAIDPLSPSLRHQPISSRRASRRCATWRSSIRSTVSGARRARPGSDRSPWLPTRARGSRSSASFSR